MKYIGMGIFFTNWLLLFFLMYCIFQLNKAQFISKKYLKYVNIIFYNVGKIKILLSVAFNVIQAFIRIFIDPLNM